MNLSVPPPPSPQKFPFQNPVPLQESAVINKSADPRGHYIKSMVFADFVLRMLDYIHVSFPS